MFTTTVQRFYSNLITTSLIIFLLAAVILLDLVERAGEPLGDIVCKALRIQSFNLLVPFLLL